MAKTKSWSSSEASTSLPGSCLKKQKVRNHIPETHTLGSDCKIQCAMYRDGTSKPIFFLENDLSEGRQQRAKLCSKHLASPDVRQIELAWVEPTH